MPTGALACTNDKSLWAALAVATGMSAEMADVPVTTRTHCPDTASHTRTVLSPDPDPDTTRPFDSATHVTCARRGVDELSAARFDWTPAPRVVRVPAQRRRAAVAPKGSHGLRSGVGADTMASPSATTRSPALLRASGLDWIWI